MYFKKKYQLSTLIALSLLVASCSADDPDDLPSGAEMEFAAGTETPASRSNSAGLSQFAVFGDIKSTEAKKTVLLENLTVTYKEDKKQWEYSGTQYWFPEHEHSFVAIHPASVLTADNTNPNYSDSQLSFTYTLPSNYKQTVDILAATHRRNYNDGKTDIVTMRFGHIMSQINIAPALNDNLLGQNGYIEFSRFELSGYKTSARFKITPATLQSSDRTDDMDFSVSHQDENGTGKLEIDFNKPIKVTNDQKYVNLFSNEDAIVMLPQSFTGNSNAKIILTYTTNNDPTSKQVNLPLNGLVWESGNSYTYKFKIDRNGLTFEGAEITNWEEVSVGNLDLK